MGIGTISSEEWQAALAALAWQVDLGVTDPVGEDPVNRYDLADPVRTPVAPAQPAATRSGPAVAPIPAGEAAVAAATAAAAQSSTLGELRAALAAFDHCELKRGARNLVFADGLATARVLVLGEAPDSEEDREGRPFAGLAGQLLDRMFAAIGLSRASHDPATALYLTNVLPWRPPANRDPDPAEIAMMRPFFERHIALADPEVIVVMGNAPLLALTGTKGILRARGGWTTALGRPVLPMAHPTDLMRNPAAKRDAWADLLSLQERLRK